MNGKPSSPVLRGLGASNGARLLDPNRVTSELPVILPQVYQRELYLGIADELGIVAPGI
jgi:hypothetical protein